MAFIILMICIGFQHFFPSFAFSRENHWLYAYYSSFFEKFPKILDSPGWLILLVLILPVIFIFLLFYFILIHAFGWIAEFLLSLILVWFSIDARDLKKSISGVTEPSVLFVEVYEHLFAIIFWFLIFFYLQMTPIFLVYPMLIALRHYMQAVSKTSSSNSSASSQYNLLIWSQYLIGILDWIPIRLLGLSFALVGKFTAVFNPWCRELTSGIRTDQILIAEWGIAALEEKQSYVFEAAIRLIDRALVLWLIVIAIYTISFLLGIIKVTAS